MIDELVVENQNLVHHICHKLYRKYSTLHEYEDLVGAGMIGLVRAAKGFKPELGYKFSTYACRGIELAVINYVSGIGPGGIRVPRENCRQTGNNDISCHSLQNNITENITFEDIFGTEQDFTSASVSEFLAGIKNPLSQKICKLKVAGYTQKQIAIAVGISQSYVSRKLKAIQKEYLQYADREV